MILRNIEGLSEWDIPAGWHRHRRPGLSAMVRLKDEATFCIAALESIAPWCGEIVIALQGAQTDGTDRLVERWAAGRRNVRVARYPFDSLPNGPGHGDQPKGSVHERAYFYNWCLARTRLSHVVKWDGDMVALDRFGLILEGLVENGFPFIRFHGYEIAGDATDLTRLRCSATHPRANVETRIFPARPDVHFVSGPLCEHLVGLPPRHEQATLQSPAYLHFKWCKPLESATKAWPEGWEFIEHFRTLADRARPGARYTGPVPSALAETCPIPTT